MSSMDVAAIVPAAGIGRRLALQTGKPFVLIERVPLLVHTLRVLQESPRIGWIALAVHRGELSHARKLLTRFHITKALAPCIGGDSREESVARGFALVPRAAKWILVHDGVRPCVSSSLLKKAVSSARRHGAIACGLPASVTVKTVDARRRVRLTLDRERLWFVQTPQVFRRDWFAKALARANHDVSAFPDDAAMVEAAGFQVRMIFGDPLNLKVTTKDDLVLAEAILRRRLKS